MNTDILMNFSQQPLQAKKETLIALSPVNVDQQNQLLPLEELHTRYYHLLIVSEDLSFFLHEHPREDQDAYTFSFAFPFGGKFILYNDIKPVGAESIVIPKTVYVAGEERAAKVFNTEKLEATQNDLHARLIYNGSGPIMIELHKAGQKVSASEVEDYLGAKAHVVMIEVNSKTFLHVHAMVHEDDLALHASFSSRGVYRIWVQLVVEGVLYTLDFTLPIHTISQQHHHH